MVYRVVYCCWNSCIGKMAGLYSKTPLPRQYVLPILIFKFRNSIDMKINEFLTLFCCLIISTTQSQSVQISNPLDIKFGDPYIIYDDDTDRYYMYGTGGVDKGFVAYSSDDLVKWHSEGQ